MDSDGQDPQWMQQLDERQRQEVKFAQMYANGFAHGTDGHHRLLLIAKMSDMLGSQELALKAANNPD